ncbi:MAG: RDD family protein [Verrucomicrobia bacterium]|nr:RDD family protein [Verrucomicrobiota bacterium]
MEYFISNAGERTGPHSQFNVIERIRDGTLKGEELAWHMGLPEWKPLRDLHEFADYWKPTPEIIAEAEHVRQVARIALDTPQPWLRFWARIMDYFWFSMLFSLLMNLLLPQASAWIEAARENLMLGQPITQAQTIFLILFPPAMFLLFVPLEAYWLSRRGTTPGKALLRIQIRRLDGTLPTFHQALLRSLLVLMKGTFFFLFFPFPQLFIMSWCRIRLVQLGTTSWDEQTGLRVEHGEPEPWRYVIVAIIIGFLALLFMMIANMQGTGLTPPLPK